MRLFTLSIIACLSLLLACQEPASTNVPPAPAPGGDSATAAALSAKIAPAPKPDSMALQGEWYLQPVLPSDTAAGKTPVVRFDLKKSRFTGNTGCNNMNGKFWFSANDSSLSFSDKIVTTKMACTGYNEKAFLKSLLLTTHYRLSNGVLTFMAEDNSALSHWARKPATAPRTEKI